MRSYLLRRAWQSLLVLFGVSVVVFVALSAVGVHIVFAFK